MRNSLFVLLFLQVFYSFGQLNENNFDSLTAKLLNHEAPNFVAETLNGNLFSLKDHRGKVVMVNFWSLSCAACFKELVDFNRIVRERGDDNFILISLMDNSKEELDKRIEKSGKFYKLKKPVFKNDSIGFEIIPDASKVLENYGFQKGFPLTVYVDERGTVRDYVHGYILSYEGADMVTNYDVHNGILDILLSSK